MIAKKIVLDILPEKCTGCLRCALACSFFNSGEREFRPSLSRICVQPAEQEGSFSISIAADCLHCGICIRYCEYGALKAGKEVTVE